MKQVFVRGLSRSGGTLMVTVLDAHPQLAMSYEIYEHLLEPDDSGVDPLDRLLQASSAVKRRFFGFGKKEPAPKSNVHTFIARAQRSGIEPETLGTMAEEHRSQGMDFSTFEFRVKFVEKCALEKMKRQRKQHWGTKTDSSYDDLQRLFPNAYFLYMQRDGRDMAASRKLVGNFHQTVEQVAKGWCDQMSRFEQFASRPGVRARLVNYERLATEPQTELREVIRFLDLPWDDRLLQFQDEDLTIYKSPMGHLSADQVNKPINTSSIGRWKRDLNAEELAAFEKIAGSMLAKLGYEISNPQTVEHSARLLHHA